MKFDGKKIIFLVLFILWVVFSVIAIFRSQSGSNDFDTFYVAGKAVLEKTGVYYVGEYYQMRPDIGPFLYPPIAACFFSLLAFLPMPVAAVIWVTLLLTLFCASIVLIFKFLNVRYEEIPSFFAAAPAKGRLFLFVVGGICLMDNLVMTQINIAVFFTCLASLVLWQRKQNVLAGIVLSVAVFLKLTPALFGLYFLTKRKWKLLLGMVLGCFLLSAVIPSFIFGLETNRIYHRQWVGRMIKPIVSNFLKNTNPGNHRLKKSEEDLKRERMDMLLIDTNQSLPAAMARLFLKDRNDYVAASRYKNMPILGGGISKEMLTGFITFVRLVFLAACIYLWRRKRDGSFKIPLEVSLVFLTITLLSPVTRSHYYVAWIFVYLTLFFIRWKLGADQTKFFFRAAYISSALYLLLALPYGEPVGMGAWSNLILWIGCAHQLRAITEIAPGPAKVKV